MESLGIPAGICATQLSSKAFSTTIEPVSIRVMGLEVGACPTGLGGSMTSASLPKYLDIARAIESQVVGRDGAKVPSSREIAAAHGVSVVTASRAIQVLRDKGLIRTVERSGSFVTPAAAVASGERYALVQRSTPGPGLQASLAFTQAGFAAIRRQEGDRGRGRSVPLRRGDAPGRPASTGPSRGRGRGLGGDLHALAATRTRPHGRTRRSSARAARRGSPSC